MKPNLIHIIFYGSMLLASCQDLQSKKFTLEAQIIDQDENPVPDAFVIGSSEKIIRNNAIPEAEYARIKAKTDPEGNAKITLVRYSERPSGVFVEKDGYYTTKQSVDWPQMTERETTSKAKSVISIKKIMNPIAMHYHDHCVIPIKNIDEKYAFDLQVGDIVHPYGKGKVSDIIVSVNKIVNESGNAAYVSKIEFANPDDGFIEYQLAKLENKSINTLQSGYLAPESPLLKHITRNTQEKNDRAYFENSHNESMKAYYFRTRTRKNDIGQITNSNYGKIYGNIKLILPSKYVKNNDKSLLYLSMEEIYFNPSNLDRNVECNTKNNLTQKRDSYGAIILPKMP